LRPSHGSDSSDQVLWCLHALGGEATLGDLLAVTGHARDHLERALDSLMAQSRAHVRVLDQGDVTYHLGQRPGRRGLRPFLWPRTLPSSELVTATDSIDSRMLQLRWFDHWLKGMDNGVDREPPLDLFIMGKNEWTKENEWPLKRTKWTPYYLHSEGTANTSAGDGTLDTIAPAAEPADTFTYDPGDPTPIPAGHRLRVAVASAAFPRYDRNLNTGGDNERDTTYVSAHQRVLHDARHPSHVTLPLIPRAGG
jgi:X-Pro dipeptidyl-peptidase C-terminal non-catalytic domain